MATHFTEADALAEDRAHELTRQGRGLTDAAALELERELAAQPENLDLRTRLLGYYMGRQYGKNADNSARNAHILWIIANRPEAPIAGLPYANIHLPLDPDAYAQAKALWLEQTARLPANGAVLNNAANFFIQSDRELADDLYSRGQALEPENAMWAFHRGTLASLELIRGPESAQVAQAQQALEFYRQALTLEPEPHFHAMLLESAAKIAVTARQFDEAKQYADELLAYGQQLPRKEAGNELHHSNLVLGRLALHSGRREEAKSYLLAAGDVAGSPHLDSFGPNMELAKALLEAGEKETVLQYFGLCAKFWKSKELKEWRKQIERGETPDFGGNLNY